MLMESLMSVCLKDTKKKKKEDRPVKPIKRVSLPPEKDDKD